MAESTSQDTTTTEEENTTIIEEGNDENVEITEIETKPIKPPLVALKSALRKSTMTTSSKRKSTDNSSKPAIKRTVSFIPVCCCFILK